MIQAMDQGASNDGTSDASVNKHWESWRQQKSVVFVGFDNFVDFDKKTTERRLKFSATKFIFVKIDRREVCHILSFLTDFYHFKFEIHALLIQI